MVVSDDHLELRIAKDLERKGQRLIWIYRIVSFLLMTAAILLAEDKFLAYLFIANSGFIMLLSIIIQFNHNRYVDRMRILFGDDWDE